ncbi:ATP-grasp domain-containing protein [Catellatospora sp. TT07R-123]|uniref:ATP-grasp domain-containing protein n=1 Tax=Catellatospora sp. TT07R-123 TaxID=2733863 RepID=UPI001FD08B91|nr:ATP-grasp domain-containing protein [Catellatospora sp. TT07R-123]
MTGVLVLAPRVTESGLAYADAARRRGMRVETLREWRVPAELAQAEGTHLYAGPLFADAVGAELGLGLLEPDQDWLARLPREVTRRGIVFTTLAHARGLRRAAFVKPPDDKSFPAKVYRDGTALPGPDVADGDSPVLVSDVVLFLAEFRLFVLDGTVVAATRYAVAGEVDAAADDPRCAEAIEFAAALFTPGMPALPSAVVVDVGLLADPETGRPEWAVIEANAAWASGHYAADPDRALETVLRSGGPRALVRAEDERYLRGLPEVVR